MTPPGLRIDEVAASIGIQPRHLELYGHDKAKVSLEALGERARRGKLVLVSAMTSGPRGEGKTTVAIGLAQALKLLGHRVAIALRQPSMGPVFGRKGGGTGAGRSSLVPEDSINLHFTGDFHAITTAHNLLAAAIDNRLHHGTTRLDPQRVVWKRVLDMDDRALRSILIGQGGQGVPRASGFDITAASEVMAAICMADSIGDLRVRLDRIVIGFAPDDAPVFAGETKVTGAMLAVLRDAMRPNLVQSVEGVPAFVHCGPFANIAPGCNSILATRMALACADYAVTEAGFGFDLGGEKFLDIKCREAGFAPDAIVIVATIRSLKWHGGTTEASPDAPDPGAVGRGLENLAAQLDAAEKFRRPLVVALNKFDADAPEDLEVVHDFCRKRGVPGATADIFSRGGEGALELAARVIEAASRPSRQFAPLYPLTDPIEEKVRMIATQIYGADGIELTGDARRKLELLERFGFGGLPVCIAKTQNSLSDDSRLRGRPRGFRITVRDFEIANGAGFIIALAGNILRMPALPRVPAAEHIDLDADGRIVGL